MVFQAPHCFMSVDERQQQQQEARSSTHRQQQELNPQIDPQSRRRTAVASQAATTEESINLQLWCSHNAAPDSHAGLLPTHNMHSMRHDWNST
jgi:hypothetical protein